MKAEGGRRKAGGERREADVGATPASPAAILPDPISSAPLSAAGDAGVAHTADADEVQPSPPEVQETRSELWRSRWTMIVALLALQLLLAVVSLAVWVWTPDAPALPPVPTATAPRIGEGATYESALPLAQRQADVWLPDAVLLNAAMQVDWPWNVPPEPVTELPGTGWLTYSFLAPWRPPGRPPGAASLGLTIDRLSGAIVNQDTDGWEQAPEFRDPPPPAEVDSAEATLLADADAGADFRRACPRFRHISRTFPVAAGRTEWPQHWVVIYEDSRAPEKHGLRLRIDADSGEVLDRGGEAPECPAP